ncbi:hypothetical protein ACWCXC_15615 [Streptomyces sp. NPDC001515]
MAATQKLDVTTEAGAEAIDQVKANAERVKALLIEAGEGSGEAAEELDRETEAIISALSGKGSIKIKTELRSAWKESVAEGLKRGPVSGEVAVKTWDQYEGTEELVSMGAEKLAEGVKLNIKAGTVAKEVAALVFDVWTRIENKDGNPDLKGDSNAAKEASGELLRRAGQGFEDSYDTQRALKRLMRSVQDFRSDVRAEWLRSLDGNDEVAQERRELVASVLENKPEGEKASEWVATAYGTDTIGQTERKRLAYHQKQAALAAAQSGEESENVPETAASQSTPDERVAQMAKRVMKDITAATPADFEAASEETRKAARDQLEAVIAKLKAFVAATI